MQQLVLEGLHKGLLYFKTWWGWTGGKVQWGGQLLGKKVMWWWIGGAANLGNSALTAPLPVACHLALVNTAVSLCLFSFATFSILQADSIHVAGKSNVNRVPSQILLNYCSSCRNGVSPFRLGHIVDQSDRLLSQ